MADRRRLELRRWIQAAACVVLTYATLGSARGIVDLLRERNLLRVAVTAALLLAGLMVVVLVVRRRPGRGEIGVLLAAATVYIAVLVPLERVEERLHFLQYGVIAALVYSALELRWVRTHRASDIVAGVAASLIVLAIGWLDEGIQHLLPERFYDLRDVFFNFVGGALAIAVSIALGRARSKEVRQQSAK